MSSVPEGGKMWKNIIIAILTTVTAYIIVHFLFDKKPGKEEFKKRKNATLGAWNSLMDYKKMMFEQMITLACLSPDINETKKEFLREMDDIKSDISNIKKELNVDNKMLTLVDYSIRDLDGLKDIYSWYLDSAAIFQQLKGKLDSSLLQQRSDSCNSVFAREKNLVTRRNESKADTILRDLSEYYKIDFPPIKGIDKFNPDALIRKWKIERAIDIEFSKDQKAVMKRDGKISHGQWRLIEKTLVIDWNEGIRYVWKIGFLNDRIFSFSEEGTPVEMGACPQ